MGLIRTVAPAAEPFTVAEAKEHLRVDGDAENTLIEYQLKAAREYVESQTGRQLMLATYQLTLDGFPALNRNGMIFDAPIRLPKTPLSSVTSIAYIDSAGASQTLAAGKYIVDTALEPGQIDPAYGEVWPATQDRAKTVTVTYVAGYSAAGNVPPGLRAATMLMLGNLFERRESTISGTIIAKVPLAVESLIWPFKVAEFA